MNEPYRGPYRRAARVTDKGDTSYRIQVRPHLEAGWEWRVDGHECGYECGAGGCDGRGWRPTKRWAIRAGQRYMRGKDRRARRSAVGWSNGGCPANADGKCRPDYQNGECFDCHLPAGYNGGAPS